MDWIVFVRSVQYRRFVFVVMFVVLVNFHFDAFLLWNPFLRLGLRACPFKKKEGPPPPPPPPPITLFVAD